MGKNRWFPRRVRCEATSNIWGQGAEQEASLHGFGPAHKHFWHPSEGGAVSFFVSFIVICFYNMNYELCFFCPWIVFCWEISVTYLMFFIIGHSRTKTNHVPETLCLEWPVYIDFDCVSFPEMTCWRHRFAGCFRMVQEIRSFVSEWEMWFLPLA